MQETTKKVLIMIGVSLLKVVKLICKILDIIADCTKKVCVVITELADTVLSRIDSE